MQSCMHLHDLLPRFGPSEVCWTNRAHWGTTAPLQFWHGVTTDADGNVTGLRLSDNGLNGSIPSGIGILASLQHLDLSQNLVSGSIPSDLGTSANLQHLDLSQNLVSGSIPSDLGSLPDLGYLNLDSNELTGPIPGELSYLRRLRYLALGSNHLTGPLPPELGVLRLQALLINDNGLSGRHADQWRAGPGADRGPGVQREVHGAGAAGDTPCSGHSGGGAGSEHESPGECPAREGRLRVERPARPGSP